MTKIEMLGTGLIVAVAGGALGLFMQYKGWIHVFPEQTVRPFQVPGYPPVTVGDGSLHAHSEKDWMSDKDGEAVIQPKPSDGKSGAFYKDTDCQFLANDNVTIVSATAFLWTDDDRVYDISPKDNTWMVKITDNNKTAVTIQVVNNLLQFSVDNGAAFDKGKYHERQHNKPGEVTKIVVQGSTGGDLLWTPGKPFHPHYTLGFCYH
jgi:hypothetical protein